MYISWSDSEFLLRVHLAEKINSICAQIGFGGCTCLVKAPFWLNIFKIIFLLASSEQSVYRGKAVDLVSLTHKQPLFVAPQLGDSEMVRVVGCSFDGPGREMNYQ